MKQIALLAAVAVGTLACTAADPVQPRTAAPSFASAQKSGFTCDGARAMVGSLTTLVRNATIASPSTRAALLPSLQAADAALAATPCDKAGATAAMLDFKAAVAANRSTISATQFIVFNRVADSIISYIAQIP